MEEKDFQADVKKFMLSLYDHLFNCIENDFSESKVAYWLADMGYFPTDEQIIRWLAAWLAKGYEVEVVYRILSSVSHYKTFNPFQLPEGKSREDYPSYLQRLTSLYNEKKFHYSNDVLRLMATYNQASKTSSQNGATFIRNEEHLQELKDLKKGLCPERFFEILTNYL